mmetsp:Transcript_74944/g.212236  ORF Transcript_74944/g.212236 Transcript_74944/m.212236 type:complete len:327 (-) Transcript_74944:423-1403(-)
MITFQTCSSWPLPSPCSEASPTCGAPITSASAPAPRALTAAGAPPSAVAGARSSKEPWRACQAWYCWTQSCQFTAKVSAMVKLVHAIVDSKTASGSPRCANLAEKLWKRLATYEASRTSCSSSHQSRPSDQRTLPTSIFSTTLTASTTEWPTITYTRGAACFDRKTMGITVSGASRCSGGRVGSAMALGFSINNLPMCTSNTTGLEITATAMATAREVRGRPDLSIAEPIGMITRIGRGKKYGSASCPKTHHMQQIASIADSSVTRVAIRRWSAVNRPRKQPSGARRPRGSETVRTSDLCSNAGHTAARTTTRAQRCRRSSCAAAQ